MFPADLKTAIPMGAATTLYFYFRPEIPHYLPILFFGIWFTFFFLDAKTTIANPHLLKHEKNLVFPFLYSRFGRASVIIQLLVEILFILLIVFVFEVGIAFASISIVSLVFGFAHLEAYAGNKKILGRFSGSSYL
jgi:hypothetical protein